MPPFFKILPAVRPFFPRHGVIGQAQLLFQDPRQRIVLCATGTRNSWRRSDSRPIGAGLGRNRDGCDWVSQDARPTPHSSLCSLKLSAASVREGIS